MQDGPAEKHPLTFLSLSTSHGNSCFAFMNDNSQTLACRLLRYFACIASLQNFLPLNCIGTEIKGLGGGGCFIQPDANTSSATLSSGLILLRLSNRIPAKCFSQDQRQQLAYAHKLIIAHYCAGRSSAATSDTLMMGG